MGGRPDLHAASGEDEKAELIAFLAENPLAGDVIPDAGGVRKVRFTASGRGKRGGAWVADFFLDVSTPLYAPPVCPTNEKADLTPRIIGPPRRVEAIKAARKKR